MAKIRPRALLPVNFQWQPITLRSGTVQLFQAVILVLLLVSGCSRQVEEQLPNERILAVVGGRTITTAEFLRRSEYVPRPVYCRGDNYIHRKTVLNSLIAEKLLALDAEDKSDLPDNQAFQAYIQGRREQVMRQWHYYQLAHTKVKLDTTDLLAKFKTAGLTYYTAYFTLQDSELAAVVWDSLQAGISFDSIFSALSNQDSIPTREIDWKAGEDPLVNAALFSNVLERGTLVPPLRFGDGQMLFIKILGWKDSKVISDADIRNRWEAVTERETRQAADRIYAEVAGELMRGKEIDFQPDTFFELAEWSAERYLRTRSDKEAAMNQALWNPETDSGAPDEKLSPLEPGFNNRTLFTLDGRAWTVGEFKSLLQSHPLVYRKRKMSRSEFPEQFKLAIVDLVRDHFINLDAYRRGYDQTLAVRLNEEQWRDFNLALDRRRQLLEEMGYHGNFSTDYMTAINDYLNPYIDSLQTAYSDKIKINIEQFEKLELTRTDMFITQQNVPYPILVPDFPVLTTDNRLDYGNILEN